MVLCLTLPGRTYASVSGAASIASLGEFWDWRAGNNWTTGTKTLGTLPLSNPARSHVVRFAYKYVVGYCSGAKGQGDAPVMTLLLDGAAVWTHTVDLATQDYPYERRCTGGCPTCYSPVQQVVFTIPADSSRAPTVTVALRVEMKSRNMHVVGSSLGGLHQGKSLAIFADGGAWKLVFRQTAGTYLAKDRWREHNKHAPTSPNYSILNQLNSTYRDRDGRFRFKIVWPRRCGLNSQEWKQTTNPMTSKWGGVQGYTSIDAPFRATAGVDFGGLEYNTKPTSLLDGSVGHDNFYYAIGTATVFKGRIPGPTAGTAEQVVELYVWSAEFPVNATVASRYTASQWNQVGCKSSNDTRIRTEAECKEAGTALELGYAGAHKTSYGQRPSGCYHDSAAGNTHFNPETRGVPYANAYVICKAGGAPFSKEAGAGCGQSNDIHCGGFASRAAIEAACRTNPSCRAYSTWTNKTENPAASSPGSPWCMKSEYTAGNVDAGHDCYTPLHGPAVTYTGRWNQLDHSRCNLGAGEHWAGHTTAAKCRSLCGKGCGFVLHNPASTYDDNCWVASPTKTVSEHCKTNSQAAWAVHVKCSGEACVNADVAGTWTITVPTARLGTVATWQGLSSTTFSLVYDEHVPGNGPRCGWKARACGNPCPLAHPNMMEDRNTSRFYCYGGVKGKINSDTVCSYTQGLIAAPAGGYWGSGRTECDNGTLHKIQYVKASTGECVLPLHCDSRGETIESTFSSTPPFRCAQGAQELNTDATEVSCPTRDEVMAEPAETRHKKYDQPSCLVACRITPCGDTVPCCVKPNGGTPRQVDHNQVGNLTGHTARQCEKACLANPRCKSFDSDHTNGLCFLSSTVAEVAGGGSLQTRGAYWAKFIYCEIRTVTFHEYVGCYKNEVGEQRREGDSVAKTVAQCTESAAGKFRSFFGMECPLCKSSTATGPGHAACVTMSNLPAQAKVADSECAADVDASGNRLGSGHRLAVYTVTSDGATCDVVNGSNAVHSRAGEPDDHSTEDSAADCQAACRARTDCYLFTWHNAAVIQMEWRNRCVFWTRRQSDHAGRTLPSSWIPEANVYTGTLGKQCTDCPAEFPHTLPDHRAADAARPGKICWANSTAPDTSCKGWCIKPEFSDNLNGACTISTSLGCKAETLRLNYTWDGDRSWADGCGCVKHPSDPEVNFNDCAGAFSPPDIGSKVTLTVPCGPSTLTSTLYSKGSYGSLASNRRDFNAVFASSVRRIIRRECFGCPASHRDIYYRRTSAIGSFDAYTNMLVTWGSKDNVLGKDFQLYSSLGDAQTGMNPWQYCNYDDPGIGFPRDYGPNGTVYSTWNSFKGGKTNVRFTVTVQNMLASCPQNVCPSNVLATTNVPVNTLPAKPVTVSITAGTHTAATGATAHPFVMDTDSAVRPTHAPSKSADHGSKKDGTPTASSSQSNNQGRDQATSKPPTTTLQDGQATKEQVDSGDDSNSSSMGGIIGLVAGFGGLVGLGCCCFFVHRDRKQGGLQGEASAHVNNPMYAAPGNSPLANNSTHVADGDLYSTIAYAAGGGVHQPAYADFDGANGADRADDTPTGDGTQDTYLQPGQAAFAPTASSTSPVAEDALAPPRPRRPSQEIAPLTGAPAGYLSVNADGPHAQEEPEYAQADELVHGSLTNYVQDTDIVPAAEVEYASADELLRGNAGGYAQDTDIAPAAEVEYASADELNRGNAGGYVQDTDLAPAHVNVEYAEASNDINV